jgi:hypothetical protein
MGEVRREVQTEVVVKCHWCRQFWNSVINYREQGIGEDWE